MPRLQSEPKVTELSKTQDLARVLKNAGVPYASYTSPCSAIFSSS